MSLYIPSTDANKFFEQNLIFVAKTMFTNAVVRSTFCNVVIIVPQVLEVVR